MLQYLIYALSAFVGVVIIYIFVLKDDSPAPKPVQKQSAEEEDDPSKPRMLILYGSQTGTAEEFSQTFASEAKRFGFRAKVMDLVDFDNPEERFKEEKLVIFIVATYGEGEPTDNARDFFEWIRDENLPKDLLTNVQYSVFGLGNKQYKIFNAVARIFDKRLEQLGAKRIFEKGEGDADDNIEEHFEDWKGRLLPELSTVFETNAEAGEETIEQKYEIRYHADAKLELAKVPFDAPRGGPPDAKNPFYASVIVNRQLLTVAGDRSTVHVEFNIKGSRMTYEAGDHLAVLPENEDKLVAEYAKRLGVSDKLDQVITLVPRKHKEKPPYFPKKCTIGTALKYYLDLTSVPRKKIIRGLYMFAKDEKEKQDLHVLASNTDEGKTKFKHLVKDTSRNVLDILNLYKSVQVPIDFFLELVPRLQPRYYSIASSSKMHPESIHVMVSVVRFKSTLGIDKQGVCSSYLERLRPNEKAYVFVRQSGFKLPSDHTKPVLMVGPGTGLAPFVGFLQQRRAAKQRNLALGDALLFFGCRKKSEDYVYEKELSEAVEAGAITKLLVAFSREQNQKVYVQHKLLEEKEKVWSMLEKGGNFYVCGDAKHMAKDVDDALLSIIETCGKKSKEEAKAYLEKMSTSSRYLRDVWAPS